MTTEQQAGAPAAHPTKLPDAEPRGTDPAPARDGVPPAQPPSAAPRAHTREDADSATTALVDVLMRALRALGDAGRAEYANRLAGQAWSAVHVDHARSADRINGLMHYLARLPADQAPVPDPTSQENTMSTTGSELDVRQEIPARRHVLIFETYTGLAAGEDFILVNDHDPKPLYYQFEAEHAGQFTWEYLEEGPEVWKVRIGRTAA